MANIPSRLKAHAKLRGMTVVRDAERDVGTYQRNGKDIVSFNLSDARANLPALLEQIDRQIHRPKAEPPNG